MVLQGKEAEPPSLAAKALAGHRGRTAAEARTVTVLTIISRQKNSKGTDGQVYSELWAVGGPRMMAHREKAVIEKISGLAPAMLHKERNILGMC
jgi:hypothetical protein